MDYGHGRCFDSGGPYLYAKPVFRRYLDQNEAFFFGYGAALGDADLAVFVSVVTNQQNGA